MWLFPASWNVSLQEGEENNTYISLISLTLWGSFDHPFSGKSAFQMTVHTEMRRVFFEERYLFKEWFFIQSLISGKWPSGEHFQKCLKFPSDFGK